MTKRSSSSSSSCSNSSSSYSLASPSLSNRLETIFKKASELCTLCAVEVCVIYYGPNGELKTWPEEREKVKNIALRYSQLDEAERRKKRVDLHQFMNKNNKNLKRETKKVKRNVNDLKYPVSGHYSPDEISQLIQSLKLSFSTLQERLRFVEDKKHKETELDHLNHHQPQSLNPNNQFSLFIYNHGDATLSQIPLSTSNFNQFASTQHTNQSEDYSALLQELVFKNPLMKQELCGYDQNMCMSDITKNNFQNLCVSNTQDCSALLRVQECELRNHLMQKKLHGCEQNMCSMDNINNSNLQHPCISNTQDCSALLRVQECELRNHLMQKKLHGCEQNMCSMGNINNSNLQHPCVSNTQDYSAFLASQESESEHVTNSNFLDPCLSITVSDDFEL